MNLPTYTKLKELGAKHPDTTVLVTTQDDFRIDLITYNGLWIDISIEHKSTSYSIARRELTVDFDIAAIIANPWENLFRRYTFEHARPYLVHKLQQDFDGTIPKLLALQYPHQVMQRIEKVIRLVGKSFRRNDIRDLIQNARIARSML